MRNEWSLILFTLLVQMSIGAFTLFAINIFNGINFVEGMKTYYLLSVLIVLICAMLSSFLHLGNSKNAIHSLNNIRSSWLSREIIFLVLFAVIVCANLLFHLQEIINLELELWILLTGMIIGLLTIYSMSKLYILKTVPVWNSINTYIQFFSSTFIMGIIFLFLFFSLQSKIRVEQLYNINVLYVSLLILLSTSFISNSIKIRVLKNGSRAAKESYHRITQSGYKLNSIISITTIVAIVITLFAVENANEISIYILCGLIVISEFTKRYLFYVGYHRIGI